MPTVTMPQLGESVAEGTIGKWLKKVGEHVSKDEPIVEIITDKVNAEVPSPYEGTLTEILVEEGQTVPNDAVIAVVRAEGEPTPEAVGSGGPADAGSTAPAAADRPGTPPAVDDRSGTPLAADAAPADTPAAAGTAPAGTAPAVSQPAPTRSPADGGNGATPRASAPVSAPGMVSYHVRMTPAVRRLVREHGVDLSQVQGSGFGGRVTREDVQRWIDAHATATATSATPPSAAAPTATAASATPPPGAAVPPAPPAAAPPAPGDALKELNPMRRAIATHMTRSLGVPVAYLTVEIDMSAVVRRRAALKRDYEAREGMSLSYVAFVTKACVEALRRHPDINAHWTDQGHWLRRQVNVGIAVAVDDGLVVPVIKDADGLSVHGLNVAINDLAARARAGKLRLEDIQGGTFTVDNTGWTGSILTLPIINVPEVAIVTMEKVVKRPVVIEGPSGDAIAVRSMMNMVIGFDHRATDGAQAGRFLGDVKDWLESIDGQTPIW